MDLFEFLGTMVLVGLFYIVFKDRPSESIVDTDAPVKKNKKKQKSQVSRINSKVRVLMYSSMYHMTKRVGIGLSSDRATYDKMYNWIYKFTLGKYKLKWTHLIRIQGLEVKVNKKEVLGYTLTSPSKNIYDLLDELTYEEKDELIRLLEEEIKRCQQLKI